MGKYTTLYHTILKDILNGKYKYKQRLPSIREMEHITGYSRTTVESAYQQLLVEGYIVSVNKVGYFVDVDVKEKQEIEEYKAHKVEEIIERSIYDFTGTSVDPNSFDMEIWKKYMKMPLLHKESLYEYGDQQGEVSLRQVLSQYAYAYRGVVSDYRQMIIGSGFQSLLYIICGLFKDVKRVGIPQSGFQYAKMVFNDFNIEVILLEEDDEGITIEALKKTNVGLLYLNTSSSGRLAKPLSISRRLEIIDYIKLHPMYIIEDDHNGELRYQAKPVPAMQAQDRHHIIYIGSFSKLLIPSIRLAYMVLPEEILELYLKKKQGYHQTVSRFEQLTLEKYIEEGQLVRQLKRLRRLYRKKSDLMIEEIKQQLPIDHMLLEETALRIRVFFKNPLNIIQFEKACKQHQLALTILNEKELLLSFSGIPIDKIKEGIQIIKECI